MIRTTFYRFKKLCGWVFARPAELAGPRVRVTISVYGKEQTYG